MQQEISDSKGDFEATKAEVVLLKREITKLKGELQELRLQNATSVDKMNCNEVSYSMKHA